MELLSRMAGFGAPRQPDISQPSLPPNTGGRDAPMGLRELVQAFAEDNGITFMPKPGRFWEGHQVRFVLLMPKECDHVGMLSHIPKYGLPNNHHPTPPPSFPI